MFGKLVKHEFRATRRIVPFVWLGTIVMAVLNLITGRIGIDWLFATSLIFLVILAVAQVILTYAVIITRYYRSLYSDEGYLTHTLPVRPSRVLASKTLVSFAWMISSVVMALVVVVVIATTIGSKNGYTLSQMYQEFRAAFTFTDGQIALGIGLFVIYAIYALLLQLAQIFFAISFGSQAVFHKLSIAAPIIFYLVFNFALEMIMLVATIFLPIGVEMQLDANGMPDSFSLVARGMFDLIRNPEQPQVVFGLGGIILSVFAMAGLFYGSYLLIKKHTSLR
jgi:hypothetical protein